MQAVSKYYKYTGLFIALAMPLILTSFKPSFSADPLINSVAKESLYWLLFALLLVVIRFGEKEPFVPLTNNDSSLKTTGLSFAVIIGLLSISIAYRLTYHIITKGPPPHEAIMDKIYKYPLWLKLMMVIRAGVIEETFYRAYGISRIQQLTGNKYLAFIIPLLLFSIGHYTYGTINHVMGAFFLGLVLTLFYLKTKNLVANIIGHTLFDSLALLIDPL